MGAASSIFGGIKAAKAAREARRMLDGQKADNQAWYDRKYNEDSTQRADAQRVLTMAMDRMRQRGRGAAGTAAVMGSGTEAVAAEKAANAQALADASAQIAASGAARKDAVENQYMTRKDSITQQEIATQQQKAANIATATQGVAQASMGAGAAVDAYRDAGEERAWMEKLLKS